MKKEFLALFDKNKAWAEKMVTMDPDYFNRLANQQKPELLWIGCSDSRVPANQIIDAPPGEVFVHRNIANMMNHNDMNILSVLQYSVEVLKVRHIIVCGHYSCGGVKASMEATDHGLIDNWIRPIKEIYEMHKEELEGLSEDKKVDILCEWNVRHQVRNVAQSTILQKAWKNDQ
ncbi:carbonic anhydrase, partial [Balneolaceae bacterium ANBcel3]|nr:carbonic anhydrase [Balneolaceae bacterium ANBcel3]